MKSTIISMPDKRASFFQKVDQKFVTMQIIPDANARNYNAVDFARAMFEMYQPPLKRVRIGNGQLTYRPPEYFAFDITMTVDSIRFYMTCGERWRDYMRDKALTVWDKSTLKENRIPDIDPTRAVCADVSLKNHSLYSLHVNRNDNRPLPAVINSATNIKNGDIARVQIIVVPYDRDIWIHDAVDAYRAHMNGKRLTRRELNTKTAIVYSLETVDKCFVEMTEIITEMLGMQKDLSHMYATNPMLAMYVDHNPEIGYKIQNGLRQHKIPDAAMIELRGQQKLSEASIRKMTEQIFDVTIRIACESDDATRADLIKRSIAAGFGELTHDNELISKDIGAKKTRDFVKKINQCQPSFRLNNNLLSAAEIAKLVQLPGAELQHEFATIENIPYRETHLPKEVTQGGMKIGTCRCQGQDINVFMPINNVDILCLPRVVVGGMGCGKTCGFGANLAWEAVKLNFGAVVIDPAMGQIGDELEKVLGKDQIKRIRFGRIPFCLDWRESKHGERSINRLANELIAFCEAASDEAGAQTVRFMRASAKATPSGKLSDMIELFINPAYRQKMLPTMRDAEQITWHEYDHMSQGAQAKIAAPVLNRLDVIMGDDYLSDCMKTDNGIDFVELLEKPGRVIVVDIPKGDLGAEGVDVIAALIATKLDLAMVLRKSRHPVFVIQDEPHQYMKSVKTWKSIAVESRKWRFAYTWMFHSTEQLPRELVKIIKSASPHYHLYTSSKETYKEFMEEISPFTLEEAMKTPYFSAINVIRADGKTVTPFLARMTPPPTKSR